MSLELQTLRLSNLNFADKEALRGIAENTHAALRITLKELVGDAR